MSRPPIQSQKLNEHLHLSECHADSESCTRQPGWWLYDKRAGMNLAMRAPTRDSAFVEVIEYWAKRSARMESELRTLQKSVDAFVAQVLPPEDDADWD